MTDSPGFPPPPSNEPPPPPLEVASPQLLKPVGITLVVYNALSICQSLVSVAALGAVQKMFTEMAKQDPQMKQVADLYNQPWIGATNWAGLVLAILGLVGSIYLLRGRNYGLAMTGAIVTMINPGGACCCLLGIGFGIWALVVLVKPEAQAVFNLRR